MSSMSSAGCRDDRPPGVLAESGTGVSVSPRGPIVCEPTFAASPPFCRSSVASTMFIAGLPIKPADEG